MKETMKYCLNCRRLWPYSAQICGSCRGSFGGRLCSNKHLSPIGATCCTICGSKKLLQAARYVDLTVPVFLASWAIGLLLIKLVIANLGSILGLALQALSVVGSFLLGQSVGLFVGSLFQLAVVCGLIYLAFRKILGKDSMPVKWFESAAKWGVRQAPRVARSIATMALKAIAGSRKQKGAPSEKRND